MDSIGRGCSNAIFLHQLFLELRVTWIRRTLMRIQRMVKHLHQMMSVGGTSIGRNIYFSHQRKYDNISKNPDSKHCSSCYTLELNIELNRGFQFFEHLFRMIAKRKKRCQSFDVVRLIFSTQNNEFIARQTHEKIMSL